MAWAWPGALSCCRAPDRIWADALQTARRKSWRKHGCKETLCTNQGGESAKGRTTSECETHFRPSTPAWRSGLKACHGSAFVLLLFSAFFSFRRCNITTYCHGKAAASVCSADCNIAAAGLVVPTPMPGDAATIAHLRGLSCCLCQACSGQQPATAACPAAAAAACSTRAGHRWVAGALAIGPCTEPFQLSQRADSCRMFRDTSNLAVGLTPLCYNCQLPQGRQSLLRNNKCPLISFPLLSPFLP